jgi:CHASE2 domain-containing sensor protein
MWNSVRRRDLVATLSVALIIASLSALPQFDRLRGRSIDILTWARWSIAGNRHDPAKSPAVVIAVDEETYRRKPFSGTPSITWTREIAKILTAVAEGGATVVGFDIILPTSLEQRRFLDRRRWATVAAEGAVRARHSGPPRQVLLGQVQHPCTGAAFEAQRVAVGQQANIRPLNLFADRDGVVRRVPLSFEVDGAAMPSMSVELAARAMGRKPQFEPDGSLSFGGAKVPQAVPNTLTINFEGGADDIPTHSLADLAACVDKGDKEYFRRHFGNRVVLFGVVLDVEDRSLTSKRLATGSEGARAPRCQLPFEPPDRVFARDSIAGVYVHATAVNNLMRGEGLRELSRPANWLINLAAAALAAGLTLLASPVPAVLGVVAIGAAWTGIATWAFGHAVVLPVIDTVVVAMFALATMIAYRFVIADSDKRLLRSSFSLYLAPAVIERMLASNTPPSLGGRRAVTVYFSDIAASAISERMSPRELVALMNEYLSAMTDIIEAHGGSRQVYRRCDRRRFRCLRRTIRTTPPMPCAPALACEAKRI